MMGTLLRDVRYGARSLLRSPGLTLVAVVTLALGIGATTAIFSVTHAVLLRSLPFADPERIVMVWENNPRMKQGGDRIPAAPADFIDWREQNRVFQHIAAFTSFSFSLTGAGAPEKLDAVLCSADFFPALGMKPALGRAFDPGEDEVGRHHVVVISDGLWRRRFGGDRGIIGRTLMLTGEQYTVVGVMPPGFTFPQGPTMPPGLDFPPRTELWAPLPFDDAARKDHLTLGLAVVARLRAGVSREQAQADMSGIAAAIDRQYKKGAGFGVSLLELREQIVGDVRLALLVLFGTVCFVLLIACANVASLLLSWFLRRQKEMAVRAALGATRARLVAQMLTEGALLSLAGGALGLLLAKAGTDALLALRPDSLPRIDEVGINGWVLGFTFLASLLAGVLAGLVPALQASGPGMNITLKEESRGATTSAGNRRVRSLLIVSEVGLTLVLLIGAGLLVKSFTLLRKVRLGFNPDNVLTMRMALPLYKYPEGPQQAEFIDLLLRRVSALPGVGAAAVTTSVPLSGTGTDATVEIEGRQSALPQDKAMADYVLASPDFFKVMETPLLRGRGFNEHDAGKSPPVVIVSEAMARSFWPGEDPIGKRLSTALEGAQVKREVVGVVGDVRRASLDAEPRPALYVPFAQNPYPLLFLAVRTKSSPPAMTNPVRAEVLSADPDQPVYDVKDMRQIVGDSSAQTSFSMSLLSIFAGLALALAMVGVYGIVSASVGQRTHEIGIRMALGAQQRHILALVMRQGLLVILIGVVAGLAAAFGLTRVMASLLYQISAADPLTYVAATALLFLVAVLAIYVPARRASKLEPMSSLREG
jgi:putative ABC transport system permease protein